MKKIAETPAQLFSKLGLDSVEIETGGSFVRPLRDLFARRARRMPRDEAARRSRSRARSSPLRWRSAAALRRRRGARVRRDGPVGRRAADARRHVPRARHERVRGDARTSSCRHGKGETVLPRGLELQSESEAAKRPEERRASRSPIRTAAPRRASRPTDADPKSGRPRDDTSSSRSSPCRPSRGATALTLPPLPVAVARANGEIVDACARSAHTIVVEDPTASTPDAQPKPNPPPRAQREEWTALEAARSSWLGLGARRRRARRVPRSSAGCDAPEARAAAAAAAPAVGGRARAARRGAPRGPARDAALRRVLRPRERRRARVPRRALRLRRPRVDDRRDRSRRSGARLSFGAPAPRGRRRSSSSATS